MRTLHLIFLLAAGCGRIGFDAGALDGDGAIGGDGDGDGGAGNGDGGTGDGSMVDGSTGINNCVPPAVSCDFPGPGPCSCWGTPMAINAGLSESGGVMTFTPNANTTGAQGACTRAAVPIAQSGVFVEVSQVVQGAGGLTAVSVGSSPDIFEVSVQNGTLRMTDGSNTAMATYDAVQMRWWRIRPGATGTVIETSADGRQWQSRNSYSRAMAASYSVRIIGGTLSGVAAPGSARFEGINVCPP